MSTAIELNNLFLFDGSEVARTFLCCALIFLFIKYIQQNEDPASKATKTSKKLNQQNNNNNNNNIQQMPTPPAMPIIGHIHLLRNYQHNPWEGFNAIRREFGDLVSLKMGVHPMALVSSSEAMKEILLKKGVIFADRPNFSRHHIIFGGDKENSLALCKWSNTHKARRKFCKRGIVPNRFSSRNQLLEKIVTQHVHEFNDNAMHNKQPIITTGEIKNSRQLVHYKITKENLLFLTSDIFMDFLCKENHSHSSPDYKEFVLGCDFVFWDINQCYLIDFLPKLTSFGVGFTYLKRLKRVTDFLRNYIDDRIFDPRLLNLKKSNNSTSSSTSNSRSTSSLSQQSDADDNADDTTTEDEDYLDSIIIEYLMEDTSMSLADYKVGFADLLAGHAAVTNILIRLLGHLALDESIQDMIYEEASRNKVDEIDYEPSLPITEASLQEALRLASSPIVPHVAREDTSVGKYYVPQGTVVLFNNYHLNLSETLWTDPLVFNPRNFLKLDQESGQYQLHIPKHFIPFSVGARQCLGYKMVEKITIVTVANLCKKYVIKANDEDLVKRLVTPKGSIALNPDAECFELKLYPR